MYLLAVLLPPVAVLLSGKPFQAILNIFLTMFFWIPGAIHAVMVVHERKANKRIKKQTKQIIKEGINQQSATKEKVNKTNEITFRVAGVTKENEKGEKVSQIIKKVIKSYVESGYLESFNSYTKKEMLDDEIEISEFEDQYIYDIVRLEPEPTNVYDKNAIKVYLKDAKGIEHHIGYVPKDRNKRVLELLKSNNIKKTELEFVGGKTSQIDYDDEKDKEVLVYETLTQGIEITIDFD